ncbi:hypothetical protein [Chitinophaga qingshengii]|uniref:DUF983 domain-containing protein n=1 Tax=Chitinophaga qingshengii TaxID=1569794 RepID=A0ABR7TY69_9BACT|nr:hypothetical protein [Chitinophaga qingshengii]MBC9934720.1 hypothetical protein [Chitinophaga qingshengii]
MQAHKCPNCGASIFTDYVADSSQRKMKISCVYCDSRFTIDNPDYEPPAPAHQRVEEHASAIPYNASTEWDLKVSRAVGYTLFGIFLFSSASMWIAVLRDNSTNRSISTGLAIAFTLLSGLFYFIGNRSARKIKRRRAAGIFY